jgi:urea carboxylase system permease
VSQTKTDDIRELAAFGYKQVLDRKLGGFSSFAAGFSYISILTGVFQMFYVGYGAGGPAFSWTWPAVFLGQLMVALCFAELAAAYPLSGGIYQWSRWIGSRAMGWLSGWVYMCCSVVTLAAVALALQGTLPQISPVFQLVGDPASPADGARNAVFLGCLLIALTTIINAAGVRLLAVINNIGVIAELVGVTLLIALLAAHARRGPAILFETGGRGAGSPLGYLGPFLAAALMASYVLYGFDTAGALAEETDEPRRRAPWAILQALAAAAFAGGLLILFGILAVRDPHDAHLGRISGGLQLLVKDTLGPPLGTLLLLEVVFAVFVCALAVHAGSVRLVFAMARDNNLPLSHLLAHVAPRTRAPVVPTVLVGALAAVILVVNIDVPHVIEALCSVAIVWANLAYLMVTGSLLAARLKGRRSSRSSAPASEPPGRGLPAMSDQVRQSRDTDAGAVTPSVDEIGPQRRRSSGPDSRAARAHFTLGRFGLAVNIAAVLWGVFVVINVGWPRPAIYGSHPWGRFAALLATLGLVGAGGLYFFVVGRRKQGILTEHAAVEVGDYRPGSSIDSVWIGQLAPGE